MKESGGNIFPKNRFDTEFESQTFSEIPNPPGNGGGPTTPGTEAVMIDIYLPFLFVAMLFILFVFRKKLKYY